MNNLYQDHNAHEPNTPMPNFVPQTSPHEKSGTSTATLLIAAISAALMVVLIVVSLAILFKTNNDVVTTERTESSTSSRTLGANSDAGDDAQGSAKGSSDSTATDPNTSDDTSGESEGETSVESEGDTSSESDLVRPAPNSAVEVSSFAAPSGNIACHFSDTTSCIIKSYNFEVPEDCTGKNLMVSVNDEASWISCGGPFIGADAGSYNTTYSNLGYACTLTTSGVNCWSEKTGKSFTVSRSTLEFGGNE